MSPKDSNETNRHKGTAIPSPTKNAPTKNAPTNAAMPVTKQPKIANPGINAFLG
jgi:hypothetical protein